MSRMYASTFVQSAMTMSGYSSTQQEFCMIGLRGAGVATGPGGPIFPSGKKVCLKEVEERRLLHQTRGLGRGKRERDITALTAGVTSSESEACLRIHLGSRPHTVARAGTMGFARAFRRAVDSQPRGRSGSAVWCPALRRCAQGARFRQ
jgi:hypothetical protein